MVAWVETYAGKEYSTVEDGTEEGWLTKGTWKNVVESSNDAWVIAFVGSKNSAFINSEELRKAEADCAKLGAVRFAKVDCSAENALSPCQAMSIKDGEGTVVYRKFDEAGGNAEKGNFALHEADNAEDAIDLAIQSLPDRVFPVSRANAAALDQFAVASLNAKKIPFLLLTKKAETPDMYTALAAKLGHDTGDCAFAVFYQPDDATLARFQITGSLPRLVSFVPQQAAAPDAGEASPEGSQSLAFGLLQYERKQLGPLSFESMGIFATSVSKQFGLKKDDAKSEAGANKREAFNSNPDVPAAYLNTANFVEQCASKALCIVGMVDGDPKRGAELQNELDVLESVRKTARKRGDPFHFALLDASCQHEFANWFDVQTTKLPTVVALSPKKLRYVQMIMTFNEANILTFLTGVKSGRISTGPIADIPTPKEVDCAAMHEEISALESTQFEEEDGDMEDMVRSHRALCPSYSSCLTKKLHFLFYLALLGCGASIDIFVARWPKS